MKKHIVTLVLTVASLVAAAQHDTIQWMEFPPYYYINHQPWEIRDTHHNGAECFLRPRYICNFEQQHEMSNLQCSNYNDDLALKFSSDTTLHVIGIAAIPMPVTPINVLWNAQTVYSCLAGDSLYRYFFGECFLFRLYTPEGDNLALLESICLDTNSFDSADCRLYITPPSPLYNNGYMYPILEVFFENELDLNSFYLSFSLEGYSGANFYQPINCLHEIHIPAIDTFILPAQELRYRGQLSSPSDPWVTYIAHFVYPHIVPIIRRDCDTCPTVPVQTVQHFQVGADQAFFRWQGTDPQRSWQLSYGPAGTAPDDGTLVDCSQPISGGIHFEPGTEYVAYVRGRCRFGRFEYGPWSAPYHFTLEGSGIAEVDYPGLALEVSPNPTDGRVTVACGEPMELLEVYDTKGALLRRATPASDRATLDLAALPAGTYLLRVTTPQAVASRKLVRY